MFEPTLNESRWRVDRLQIAAVLGLICLGAAFVYSATMAKESARLLSWYDHGWVRQIVWYVIGIAAAAAICFVEYHTLARWSFMVYWCAIGSLVTVFFIGTSHGWGAVRWIDFGPFQIQPSEFAKLAFILSLANFLGRPVDELRDHSVFWRAIGLTALPFCLIMAEPDLGSALVFFPVGLVMMFVAGTPPRYLVRLGAVAVGLVALILVDIFFAPPSWYKIKLEDYQRHRLLVYFGLDFAPANASKEDRIRARQLQDARSYQVRQALISVGSGGLTGKGLGKGTQTALGFLPPGAAHNDFIFSVIAEEKGFVGSVTVLTLYAVVLFTGIRIAGQARDRLGKVLAAGVVALLFTHVFINIGMNIRIVPVTGIPLPLLSYGGSSVLGSLIAMGLLQNVYIYRKGY
jgi:rod shape determining protein RodA